MSKRKIKQKAKPGPRPKPEEELLVMVAGRVSREIKKKVKAVRERRKWTESEFVRNAVERALAQDLAA